MDKKSISTNPETSPFLQQHSAALLIWHWLTFLFLTGSMVTVLFNSTLLSPRDNLQLVQDQLSKKGITVNNEQALAVSHGYEDKVWNVHKYFGFGLAILFLARVVIEFTQPEEEKMRNRLQKAIALSKKNDPGSAEYKHYMQVKLSYMLFFLLLFLMVFTGLGMAFGRGLGFSREISGALRNLHAIVQYLIYTFIVLHLGGVILAENGKMKGIVSGMIHGNRP